MTKQITARTVVTATVLHRLGYRKAVDCYFKCRRVGTRPENRATVQVQLRGHGWFDVNGNEKGSLEFSKMLKKVRQLRDWESFIFCT